MNPEYFSIRTIPETLSTLVHEMVHLQQQHFGTPGRGRYHNHEWANWMECVGLVASHTGKIGGHRTGDKMTHYIAHGAKFDSACNQLITTDFTLSWVDRFPPHKSISSIIQKFKLKPPEPAEKDFPEEDDNGQLYLRALTNPVMPDEEKQFLDDLSKLGVHIPIDIDDPNALMNRSNRTKYSCSNCQIHVWGKPKLNIICGECQQRFESY